MNKILFTVTILLALVSPALAGDQCAECHEERIGEIRAKKVIHSAIEDDACEDCHESHGDDERLVLVEEGSALCLQCHDDPAEGKVVHEAVTDGDCIDCHDPHSSDKASLLVDAVPELCLQCHDDPTEGKVVHEAVSDGSCTDCHNPHSSDQGALLTEGIPDLCSQCHDIPDEMNSLTHTALSDGECTDCHDPHSTEFSKLLIDKYETTRFPGGFSEEMYPLCFLCHESSLVTGGPEDTNFSNGSKNLHNVHVMGALKPNRYGIAKRGKARSCSICHSPHGTTQPFSLISKYVHKGIIFLTMTYTPSEDGGNCTVGCHKPQDYNRTAPDPRQGG